MDEMMMRYNLQFFAEDTDNSTEENGDGDDNQQGEKSEKGKFYTQEEIDEMISRRLAKERKKAEKEKSKSDAEKGKSEDDKAKDKANEASAKLSALEAKLLCFEHDVAKESVSDVVALAKSYVDDDTDFEEAIEKVIKKYPQFVKGSKGANNDDNDDDEDETTGKSWGKRQKGKDNKVDGVEAAFLKKNPGLKID